MLLVRTNWKYYTEAKPAGLGGSTDGSGSAAIASVALTLPLGPSTTLETVYDAVGKEWSLGACSLPKDLVVDRGPSMLAHGLPRSFRTTALATGDRPFAICCLASGQPLALRDLHAGNDLVAYVDSKRPKPAEATAAGAETLPLPPGPKPALLSKNFEDAFRPAIGSAHMKVRVECAREEGSNVQ